MNLETYNRKKIENPEYDLENVVGEEIRAESKGLVDKKPQSIPKLLTDEEIDKQIEETNKALDKLYWLKSIGVDDVSIDICIEKTLSKIEELQNKKTGLKTR